MLLRVKPQAWQPEDCLLVAYAMFFGLQDSGGDGDRTAAIMREVLPRESQAFFMPKGSSWDAAIDDSELSPAPIPPANVIDLRSWTNNSGRGPRQAGVERDRPEGVRGSNNWGVDGHVSASGGAIIANDKQRATQLFTSSQIYNRNGNLLYELLDTEGGRRTFVPLDKISPWVQRAAIATEDPRFYRHPGFDVFGIARAIVQNVRAGEGVSGASTIAQQLVLNLMLPEGRERSLTRRVREAVLAAEVTRQYPRDKILELYLNSINYGNLAYGIEAAARTYFNKDAAALTLAEASLLAGIPQAPAIYDPFTHRRP